MVSAQFWGNTAFCVYLVHVKYWCAANSNLAYFIELTTTLECQKQLLMSNISNLGGRESRETAVRIAAKTPQEIFSKYYREFGKFGEI